MIWHLTYLPDTKSKSLSYFVISFTKDFTLSPNMYAVAKEILRVNEKLDIGGVRLPLENLQEADKAIAKEAAVMVKEAKEKYL